VLTEGHPSDVDVNDEQMLLSDNRQTVQELTQQGIHSHCISPDQPGSAWISLDQQADAYVHDIFLVIIVGLVEQRPERLISLF
jgi:nitric oxide reductase NorD protein